MLFNSVQFIFVFLPVALTGFFLCGTFRLQRLALFWMLLASLVFYGWSDPFRLIPLIVASATFNFCVGRALTRRPSRFSLVIGIGGNVLLLGYFKYAAFLVESAVALLGIHLPPVTVALPIGISFYTLTQIAFLVDAYRKLAQEYKPLNYGVFVTFFPHLVAGPILHHKEIMPQFDDPDTYRFRAVSLAHGLAWFAAGLFKKVIFADGIAPFADAPFKLAASGSSLSFSDAWVGVGSYALQIYFDFSGYCDMAIGLALMMGVTFPLNFNSPYKASSMIEFWRRWHMTLSRFLRDDLYIPLGGNRRGLRRRYANLMATMLIGGLWHGASWNFVIWGGIHGVGLVLNHLWRDLTVGTKLTMPRLVTTGQTMLWVLFAWVPFRADTFGSIVSIWRSMLGQHGLGGVTIASTHEGVIRLAVLGAIVFVAPNTQEILGLDWRKAVATPMRWRPRLAWAVAAGAAFGIAVAAMMTKSTAFLYFRF
jgi:D-alanyl-lipoteichoic acid acyltransferase DltB (MBOAT superfamily)